MVVYPEDPPGTVNVTGTGSHVFHSVGVIASQPSTWPRAPREFDLGFHTTLVKIFREAMVDELRNVVQDILKANPKSPYPFANRGHVVMVAYMCALDAISSYGYKNKRVKKFVRNHFPADYKPHANRIYPEYRLSLVHAWNLFGEVALLPGNEPIRVLNGSLQFGVLNFVDAFEKGVNDFLSKLKTDSKLQHRALHRYRELTGEVKPSKVNHTTSAAAVGLAIGVAVGFIIASALSARQ